MILGALEVALGPLAILFMTWLIRVTIAKRFKYGNDFLIVGFSALWGGIFTAASYFLFGLPITSGYSDAKMLLLCAFMFGPGLIIVLSTDPRATWVSERMGNIVLWSTCAVITLGLGAFIQWQATHSPGDIARVSVGLHLNEAERGFKIAPVQFRDMGSE